MDWGKSLKIALGIALFAAGGVVGNLLLPPVPGIKELLELISYAATVAMAVVAIATLRAWKYQFSNSKRHEALVRLLDALHGMDVYRRYAASFRDLHFRRYGSEAEDDLTLNLETYTRSLHPEAITAFERYKLAWSEASIYLGDRAVGVSAEEVRQGIVVPTQLLHAELEPYNGRQLSPVDWRNMAALITRITRRIEESTTSIIEEGGTFLKEQIRTTVL